MPTTYRVTRVAALTLALITAACAPDAAPEEEAAAPAATTPAAPALPPGGLETWVAEIAAAADSVVTLSATDLKAAQQRAMMLYIERQEVIELNYGPSGRMSPPPVVAEAVAESERRFHRVLALVNATDSSEVRAQIAGAVDALKAQHAEVVRLAKEAGLELDPHAGGAP